MEVTAVSLARSVLDGVVSSARSAVADEVAQLLGVPREVEFIRSELEMMKSFIKTASVAHPEAAVRNVDTLRTWVKQVRDLAYDVEDCLLDFESYAATSRASWSWSWLPGPLLAERHRIAARIRELKARVEELNQRNLRYHIAVDHIRQLPPRGYSSTYDHHLPAEPEPLHQATGQTEGDADDDHMSAEPELLEQTTDQTEGGTDDDHLPAELELLQQATSLTEGRTDDDHQPVEPELQQATGQTEGGSRAGQSGQGSPVVELSRESDIIGRDHDKVKLTNLLSRSHARNTALNVVSVWGMGGMGKSLLVKTVHNNPVILDQFDCSAWVTVPHPLDRAEEFRELLKNNLNMPPDQQDMKAYLLEKRYVIIVDDLLTQDEWDLVWQVLVDFTNDKASRVIVTTRRNDVAEHCTRSVTKEHGHVHKLNGLDDKESKHLFYQKVYKKVDHTLTVPDEMAEQAKLILKQCRGLPLAISTIGGLLANRPKTSTEWMKLHEYLGAELESDELRDITRVIVSSYNGLPYYLKQIFLYLSIFPENHEIKYNRMLRRWIAEGYIAKNQDMPVEEVGDRYYNELINRSMIEPSEKKINRANRCRVHGMVLKIILSRAVEENQLFRVEKHCREPPMGKTRHLVVSGWKDRKEKLHNINMSHVRSLTVFGCCPASLISSKMRLLRVLDLEETVDLENQDLKHIGKLHHLRYLCLRRTKISELPSLENLEYLETLDIRDTHVTWLPRGIAKLQKLRYLIAGGNFSKDLLKKAAVTQPNMSNHRAAHLCFNPSDVVSAVDKSSVWAPKGIEKLGNLHMLSMINIGRDDGMAGKIKEMTSLQRLGVAGLTEEEGREMCKSIESLGRLHSLELRFRSLEFLTDLSIRAAPRHLVSLRLCGKLLEFPEWIRSLNELAKVKLFGTQLNEGQVALLGDLPNLAFLGLWDDSYTGRSLSFHANKFPKLRFLDINGLKKIKGVEIKKKALPKLERLWLNYCTKLRDDFDGLCGVPHLPNLKELVLKNCGDKEELMKTLQEQISRHSKRPKFLVGKIVPAPSNLMPTVQPLRNED